jgi:hypothetical protein
MQSYLLYHGRIPHSFMNGVLYDKSCYYNGTLNWDYGCSVSTCGLNLSLVKVCYVCSHALYIRSWSLFINFIAYCICWADHILCINFIDYLLNYYRYYCSDLLFAVFYVIMYWQVLYPHWWIAEILNILLQYYHHHHHHHHSHYSNFFCHVLAIIS